MCDYRKCFLVQMCLLDVFLLSLLCICFLCVFVSDCEYMCVFVCVHVHVCASVIVVLYLMLSFDTFSQLHFTPGYGRI